MKILRKVDIILLFTISIAAIFISLADFFDWFPVFQSYFSNKIDYPLFCLVLLGLIGSHLTIRFIAEEDHKEISLRKINDLINTSDNIKVRTFEDSFELETYLAKRILEATQEVCDLTWKLTISSGFSLGKRIYSHDAYEKAVEEVSDKLIFREVWIFNDQRRVDKFNKRISKNKAGYSCRYYRDDINKIPRMQFVIIDNSEVIFFATAKSALLCAIKGEVICKVFKPYFDEIWNAATPIKEGDKLYEVEIKYINKKSGKK